MKNLLNNLNTRYLLLVILMTLMSSACTTTNPLRYAGNVDYSSSKHCHDRHTVDDTIKSLTINSALLHEEVGFRHLAEELGNGKIDLKEVIRLARKIKVKVWGKKPSYRPSIQSAGRQLVCDAVRLREMLKNDPDEIMARK